ncbi:MAG: hypothetical protein JJ975_17000, partial [Bacteroidia bacterium]|nr:hypothetical protein [Bacteroidia bacterium]
MTRKIYPIFKLCIGLVLSGLLLGGCATGKKRFEQGDYDTATLQAIKRLRNNPDSKKARKYLPMAYEHAVDYHLDVIEQLKNNGDRFKYDEIAHHYDRLNYLYNEIIRCPACVRIIDKPRIFQKEYNESTLAASKAHFEAGLEEMEKGTKEAGRLAYGHFLRAKNFTPKYAQIDQYLIDARRLGTIRVLIEDIPVHSRRLALTNEFFQNQIVEHVRALNYTFVEFYREAELEGLNLQPDQVVVMKFDDFVVGQTHFKEKTQSVERDSVKIGTVETESGVKPVYGVAKAEITMFEKTLTSSGLLDFQIVDALSGATLQQRKLPGTFVWQTNWATY